MNDIQEKKMKSRENILASLWMFPAIVPLLVLLFSFILHPWTWGLMDDVTILKSGHSVLERFGNYFSSLCDWGVFRPTFAIHSAVFYTVFEHTPKLFYIFKFFEVCLVLIIWGNLAARLTKTKVAFVLLPAVTLSFHYFYDIFFFLSSHEYLGLMFLGLAIQFFYSSFRLILAGEERTHLKPVSFGAGLVCLFCAFGAKETFVSTGIAIGLTFFVLAWCFRNTRSFKHFLFPAIIIILFSSLYAVFLMTSIKSEYTSGYSFFGNPKIFGNLRNWLKKDFLNHFPWILCSIFVSLLPVRAIAPIKGGGIKTKGWAIIFSVLLYGGFLAILLPWNVLSYYSAPLGLFFALIVVLWISNKLTKINLKWNVFFVLCSLLLNLFVCQYALKREKTYQYDSIYLQKWMSQNILFKTEVLDKGLRVRCNAQEASEAIPQFLNRKYNAGYEKFIFTPQVKDIVKDQQTKYFLLGPSWGDQDLRKLGDMWTPMFVSKSWYVFRRMY